MNFEYLRAILLCASLSFSCYDTVISTGTSIFECLETDIASGLKLVSQMVGKTNFLSRSTLSSQSFPLSSDDVRFGTPVSSEDSPCFTNWSCLLRVWWSFPCFFLHLQHISQLPQDFVTLPSISPLSQIYLASWLSMRHGPSLSTQLTVWVFT